MNRLDIEHQINVYNKAKYKKNTAIRDAVIIELLFSTGIRVSELCNIKNTEIDLDGRELLIYVKGVKERMLQIGNDSVIMTLKAYETIYHTKID
ncbi:MULTISPECIES: tyrosine-type recombinase/integrase [unclassified Amedibacterium]|uniref:tyrosine-type recombinase/integrase n=1 Tax=unclassified Amedibacterium TaxID=3088137 RepID=UPI000E3F8A1E|nr:MULTISPECIES: tyrosine-type recombinase/integrase [unclassified Absiella]RGB65526.1 hypothetical protein DW113_11970 [Absiella sp. AM09-45]RGB74512.1 hypothetical protein DW114_13655 [Absiella sp. AM09-50]RGC53207.1 hypothetical protein DW761_02300 [Absiella sp. AM29-15]